MVLNARRRRDRRRVLNRRVSLDGVDVTDRCYYADGRRGVARLYRLNADGKKYIVDGAAATEERRGRIQWGRRSPGARSGG